jgi:sialic acid synthase SpsE
MKNETYIIGEIGQNHNGDIDLARTLIDMSAAPIYDNYFNRKLPGINAVKLTKRDLSEELTSEAAAKPYDTPNSFGATYGEHREALELSYEEHAELARYAKSKGLDVVETLCSPKCVKLVEMCEIDRLKVASRDLTNIPLLEAISETKIPIILSTGMSGVEEIDAAIEIIGKHHENISILHCLSQYPADYSNLNLNAIASFKSRYPKFDIGYSDHSIGVMVPAMAVALGATIVEKHITISRSMKGSDHAGSIEMDGLWRMTRDIRNAELSMGDSDIPIHESVKPFLTKLRRSLAVNKDIKKGGVITKDCLTMLSPGDGLRWEDKDQIIGKVAKVDIAGNTLISLDDLA